jgi:4-hydroxybenzoate polyprenyltransferase
MWIVLAFTGARTAAMGFNRIVDRDIDAANPRTASREIPAGTIKVSTAWAFTLAAVALVVGSAGALGRLALLLSPLCLVVIFGYSLFKRFSWSAHLFLGMALALAPGGAWVAVTGSLEGWPLPLLLMGAVASWVAGFDVIYSLQDEAYDREVGLHSIPVKFGTAGALVISAFLHLLTVTCLVGLQFYAQMHWLHGVGVALIAVILVYEHWIVRPTDLSRIGKAFFDLNGRISVAYLACTAGDLFLLG